MSERDSQRQGATSSGTREHAEEQVVGGCWPDTAAAWAVELLIAAVIGLIMYLLGIWTAAVLGGVIWLAAAVMRTHAVRLQRRQRRGTRRSQ